MTPKPDPIAYPPRGMSRDEAARYIGVGTTKFDQLVADKRMPRPKQIDGRVIWDRFALDAAFPDLGRAPENMIDAALRAPIGKPPRRGSRPMTPDQALAAAEASAARIAAMKPRRRR